MDDPLNLLEFEARARETLPAAVYDYYAGGADDERALRGNRAAFEGARLYPRALAGVGERRTATTLLGHPLGWPVLVAPTAFQRLAHPEGELATARATAAAGSLMVLSTLATTAMEAVAAVAPGRVWFQLYVYRDRGLTASLVERAEAAGCGALVLTVDSPVWGRRERDARNNFTLPPELEIANVHGSRAAHLPRIEGSGLAAYVNALFDPGLTWPDLERLCRSTRLPVVVKGVMHPEDARLALEHGAAAVWVSNHGGRQLDASPATLEALPAVAEAVGGQAPVIVDGGVRRGADVVKALACGAQAVAVGRPVLWGLAAGGEAGVGRVLGLLREELDTAMALCGADRLERIGPACLAPRGPT